MARNLVLLLLVTYSTSMEMRETVQRMVMVRTTGSDLQPAATGFIYKKETDGPAKVVKMGESEVMEQLTKLYEQPKSFAAPIPVTNGPFHKKDVKLPSYSESKVIPVVEKQDAGHIAGTANDDYEKVLSDYVSTFEDDNDKSDFEDYLKSVGYSNDEAASEKAGIIGAGDETVHHRTYGDQDKKEYGSQHKYAHGGAADYDSAKYESYTSSGEGDQKKSYDDAYVGNSYPLGHGYKSEYEGHKAGNDEGEADDGFHNLFDSSEYAKDNDYDDGEAIESGFHKLNDGHVDHGADAAGVEEAVGDAAGYQDGSFGEGGFNIKAPGGKSADHSAAEDDTSGLSSDKLPAGGSPHSSGGSYHYQVIH